MLSHNDATEEQRERTESQRKLLNSELNHRVKNILALVKSIATQTGANSQSVDEYAKSFAKAGGVGIADSVYRSLLAQQEARAS